MKAISASYREEFDLQSGGLPKSRPVAAEVLLATLGADHHFLHPFRTEPFHPVAYAKPPRPVTLPALQVEDFKSLDCFGGLVSTVSWRVTVNRPFDIARHIQCRT
jgi:hypothetical protein